MNSNFDTRRQHTERRFWNQYRFLTTKIQFELAPDLPTPDISICNELCHNIRPKQFQKFILNTNSQGSTSKRNYKLHRIDGMPVHKSSVQSGSRLEAAEINCKTANKQHEINLQSNVFNYKSSCWSNIKDILIKFLMKKTLQEVEKWFDSKRLNSIAINSSLRFVKANGKCHVVDRLNRFWIWEMVDAVWFISGAAHRTPGPNYLPN